jgi:hypothetical protein
MKKEKLFLRHRYGKAEPMALDPANPSTSEQAADIPEKNRVWPKRGHNLINLLLQTRAYAHKIAFSWCNSRDLRVRARLDKCNKAVRKSMMVIWPGRNNGPKASSV